ALVIGGGVAGMSAALNLSRQGFQTYLIEKEDKLGGRLNSLYKLFPHQLDASGFFSLIIKAFFKAVMQQTLEQYGR
ncbi:unnamed protein product, partial [marine sediment metagenome]